MVSQTDFFALIAFVSVLFQSGDSGVLLYSRNLKSIKEAQEFCRMRQMTLVKIESWREHERVIDYIYLTSDFSPDHDHAIWAGLMYDFQNKVLVWIADGSTASYPSWSTHWSGSRFSPYLILSPNGQIKLFKDEHNNATNAILCEGQDLTIRTTMEWTTTERPTRPLSETQMKSHKSTLTIYVETKQQFSQTITSASTSQFAIRGTGKANTKGKKENMTWPIVWGVAGVLAVVMIITAIVSLKKKRWPTRTNTSIKPGRNGVEV